MSIPALSPVDPGPLDWSQTPLEADYAGHYVKIIDNLFSDAECADLIALALSDQQWQEAEVNYGMKPGESSLVKDYRNGERIIRFDKAAGRKIYEKLLPYIQEIVHVRPGSQWEGVFGRPGLIRENWECVGINECLRFLRYQEGGFFRTHCDGQLDLPDGRCARVTVQIYLGEGDIEGGATRIHGWREGEEFLGNYFFKISVKALKALKAHQNIVTKCDYLMLSCDYL